MRVSIKEVCFAVFFLVVIALVAVEAAESHGSGSDAPRTERPR